MAATRLSTSLKTATIRMAKGVPSSQETAALTTAAMISTIVIGSVRGVLSLRHRGVASHPLRRALSTVRSVVFRRITHCPGALDALAATLMPRSRA